MMASRASRHEESWLLLPWLANGRLPLAERAALEEHLRECAACTQELAQQRLLCQVLTAPENLAAVREAIENAGFTIDSSELTMLPKTTVEVADEGDAKKVLRLMDQLEDNDDVQDVYANFDIPERVLEAVAG